MTNVRETFAEITPVFVGFFPKKTAPKPDFLKADHVTEIASVSNCISAGPANWIQHWRHNAYGFFDSERIAESVLGADEQRFDMYAFALYQVVADDGNFEAERVISEAENPSTDYELLGYDVVSKSVSDFFECSPLSCNSLADKVAVNAYCLIDDQGDAFKLLLDMGQKYTGVEPGPYFLFRVHRRRRQA